MQYHWNYMEIEKFKYMLEIEILRNSLQNKSSQKYWGVLRGAL